MRLLRRFTLFAVLLALSVPPALAQDTAPQLSLLGRYETNIFDEGAAEIASYDAVTGRLFFVNADANEVVALDISDPASPMEVGRYSPPMGGGANSVAAANGQVAVAVEADDAQDDGQIVFLDASDLSVNATVAVGALPDGVAFSPDGSVLVVAGEGEPSDDYQNDPLGTISVIDASAYTEERLDFTAFNDGGPRADELPDGVRIFGPGASVAQDLEPEYPVISSDGNTAYVSLQENNAVAVVDLAGAPSITRIDALGYKDHRLSQNAFGGSNAFDPSNDDDGINIGTHPALGMYQPDALAAFEVGGQSYYATANEGDARDYDGYSEESDLGDLLEDGRLDLDDDGVADTEIPAAYSGLLDIDVTSATGDTDGDGLIEEVHVFGGRSFTIVDAGGDVVFESGDMLEQVTADALPDNFNADNDENDSFDGRSDAKGPEPEAVTAGVVDGVPYLFVGLERVSGVAVFDASDPAAPQFVQYVNPRDFSVPNGADDDLQEAVQSGTVGDLGPESIVFIPADQNESSDQNLVAVSNEVSGTVSLFAFGSDATPNAWVNEFHYDNGGADEGEFVEVVVPEGFSDLENMAVVLYNGNADGATYGSQSLDAFTEGDTDAGNGFTLYTYDFTANGGSIQNGGSDAIALCYQGAVVESGGVPVFLSYEGSLTATEGCADGLTSTDVGVSETGDEAPGQSLQLTGGGRTYAALADSWSGPVTATPGAVNAGQALPVEVVAFHATPDGDDAVVLTWETASETGNAGFRIEQKRLDREGAVFEPTGAGLIDGRGTTQERQPYRHRLDGVALGQYRFRLRQVDTDGTEQVVPRTAEVRVGLQEAFRLSGAYPNPFRTSAKMKVAVREAQRVVATLYDVRGRRVRTLYDGPLAPNQEETLTIEAENLASGVYLWRVEGETFSETGRVVMVR